MRIRRRAALALPLGPVALCALVALGVGGGGLAAPAAAGELVPARGGAHVFRCIESGPVAVVGEIASVRNLDAHGRAAELVVERALAGEVASQSRLTIAWEEPALERPVRFADGDRVLVCLTALPPQSIWLSRLPNPALRNRALYVAEEGGAFLRSPSIGGLLLIEHYLALDRSNRSGPGGVDYLIQIVEGAEPEMASAALERLASVPALDSKLDGRAATRLVDALLREDASPELEADIVKLIGRQHLERTRPLLEALAEKERPPVAALNALAQLDGELRGERAVQLLESPEASYRVAAARYAAGAEAERRLRILSRSDPVPAVRSAAITRLVALRGDAAVDTALGTLADPDLGVRAAAAKGLGSLGPSVVPVLRHVVDTGEPEAAQAAVGALRWTMSPEARIQLVEIAETHPDPAIRTLAKLAIGRNIGHED